MSNFSYTKKKSVFKEWLRHHFFEEKLSSGPGIALLIFFAVTVGCINALIDYRAGFGLVLLFSAILLVILFMRYPYFGLYFLIGYSSFPYLLDRLFIDSSTKIEFHNLTDILTFVLLVSVITKPEFQRSKEKKFWGNPITSSIFILLFFYFIEAMNPNMGSILGWFSYLRNYVIIILLFYILFCLLKTWATIKFFIYFNIALTTLLAMYACKQQWFGIADFERHWLTADPKTFARLFQGGMLRLWSTLPDPATSGILFVSVTLQCIVLLLRETRKKAKLLLGAAVFFNLLGYTYSGTRTCTLMLVAGIAFYGIATIFEKRTMLFLAIAVSAFTLLMVSPYSPPSVTRIKSAFEGTKDASAAIRDYDRHQVQPYLYQHPMGGGIFTVSPESYKYNPGHYLADLQPDSGYMKVFGEQGWVGLGILLITYFLILSHAVHNFYSASKPEFQNHSIALITLVFSLMVGQYSQFGIGPYPEIITYLGALVFFIKMPALEKKLNQ